MGDGVPHHLFGDLIEGHPVGLLIAQSQHLLKMPGNGLAFPVRVGGQKDFFTFLGALFQVVDDLFLALDGLVIQREAALHIHADLAFRQIPHMAHGGLDLIPGAQIFTDGLGLCRRLHDDEVLVRLFRFGIALSVLRHSTAL